MFVRSFKTPSRLLTNHSFELRQELWKFPNYLLIKNPSQLLCNRLFASNNKLIKYIPPALVTSSMIQLINTQSNKEIVQIARSDIFDRLGICYSSNLVSPLVEQIFIEHINQANMLINLVPTKYRFIDTLGYNPANFIFDEKYFGIELDRIRELVDAIEFGVTNYRETPYDLIINSNDVNRKLCRIIFESDSDLIVWLPEKFVSKSMIIQAIQQNPLIISSLVLIKKKYFIQLLKSLIRKNPLTLFYVSDRQLEELPIDFVRSIILNQK